MEPNVQLAAVPPQKTSLLWRTVLLTSLNKGRGVVMILYYGERIIRARRTELRKETLPKADQVHGVLRVNSGSDTRAGTAEHSTLKSARAALASMPQPEPTVYAFRALR